MKTTTLIQSPFQAKNSDLEKLTPSRLLSEFKTYHSSSFSFTFYLSNKNADNNLVDSSLFNSHLDKIKLSVINFFGGVSIQNINGYYKNSKGEIISENISILTFHSFDKRVNFKKIKHILNLFFQYGKQTKQECVMLSFNSTTTLVYL